MKRNSDEYIFGGSGGDEEESSASVTEASDTLASKQYLKVVDLLSEGQIGGLVNGFQSVIIAGTPLQNTDGSYNAKGFSVYGRTGAQNQTAIDGFSQVESAKSVGVQVKQATPIIRTIESPDATQARVSISIPSLRFTNLDTGETGPTAVELNIETRSAGGNWKPAISYQQQIGQGGMGEFYSQTNSKQIYAIKRADGIGLCINYTGVTTNTAKNLCYYKIEASLAGQNNWSTVFTGSFDCYSTLVNNPGYGGSTSLVPANVSNFHSFTTPVGVAYDFRTSVTGSNGNIGDINLTVSKCTGWSARPYERITGKASDKYVKDYLIKLVGTAPFDIRVSRLSADSTSQYLENDTYFESYTEIIPYKFTYPNSAIVAMSIDASLYNNVPDRAYEVKGIICKVPTTYDPVNRTYTGIWNGASYKLAWTDNPVWILLDLLINTRYGLGNKISLSQIDVAKFYEISMYCDELVSDGFGGYEPRYTCSMYIQGKTKAMALLSDIASVFQGYLYWAGGKLSANYDHPSDPVWQFTNANVIGGQFAYEGTDKSTRYTTARVSYTDRQNGYIQKVEYVEDREGILKWGMNSYETSAVGCMSRGQAHRLGKNILLTNRYLTEVVSFKTGIESSGASLYPGDVVSISDSLRAGKRLGGRIKAATLTSVTLDSEVDLSGASWTLSVLSATGEVLSSPVTTTGVTSVLNVSLASVPQQMSVWILQSAATQAQLFRVTAIKEDEPTTYSITAVAYNPTKYAAIEDGVVFTPLETGGVSTSSIDAPKNVVLSEELYFDASRLLLSRVNISVRQNSSPYFKQYVGSWRYAGGNWTALTPFSGLDSSIQPVSPGTIEVALQSQSTIGVLSPVTYSTITVIGKQAPPSNVTGFGASINKGTAYLTWDAFTKNSDLDVAYYIIKHSTSASPTWQNSITIADKIAAPSLSVSVPAKPGTYMIKAVDSSGNLSVDPALVINNISNLENYNVVESWSEQPTWSGTKTNCVVFDEMLLLSGSTISEWTPLVSAEPLATNFSTNTSGSYLTHVADFGGVFTSRLTFNLETFGYLLNAYISGWVTLDQVDSMTGTSSAEFDVKVAYRISNDIVGEGWGEWISTFSGEVTCRYIQFKIDLEGYQANVTPAVQVFDVSLDMQDRVDGKENVACPATGVAVVYSPAFLNNPAVAIVAQGMATGDYYTISGKSSTGFTIRFFNSANTGVVRTFDWVAKGYGFKYN